ncbi:MAG: AAA family ATPase [Actinobacteria bacterium]|uniref:DNA 3'-5' helicase n=1 Tax=freshwater metagenome TaxID=449393 RepID=A0A6J7CKP3_9ZZZZ|nr:AAA family ATPase [Actinomycetota bacterium]
MSALIESLDENQRKVALALVGPVRVLAGAGSGKTRAITHRIAYGVETGVYSAEKVLALSFTVKAAGEMRSRLSELGVEGVACRTFHSAAMRQLAHFWPDLIGGDLPKVLHSKAATLKRAAAQLNIRATDELLRGIAAEIEWRKVRLLSMEDYEAALPNRPLPGGLSVDSTLALVQNYEDLKDYQRNLDFEDTLIATLGMLNSEKWVADRVHEQFRFFVIDEYQDVSPVQRALLDAWRGSHSEVCVVGDPNQTVFGFAGASDEHLVRFESEFPGATTVELDRNYRSTPEIVRLANSTVPNSPLELVSMRESGPMPGVIGSATDEDEARAIGKAIRAAIESGTDPADIAVLYRINVQSLVLEQILGEMSIPFRVRGGRFFDEPVVTQALVLVRGRLQTDPAASARDTMALILRENLGWLSKPPANPVDRHAWNIMSALAQIAENLPETATVIDLAAELKHRTDNEMEPAVSAVTLSTTHNAKGLEWDTVFVIGMSEGLFPLSYSMGDGPMQEERRLAYVAFTRAGRSLTLSWAERQKTSGPLRKRSRFIPEHLG